MRNHDRRRLIHTLQFMWQDVGVAGTVVVLELIVCILRMLPATVFSKGNFVRRTIQ